MEATDRRQRRCMWPVEQGNLKVPLSGRQHLIDTIRICGQPARWRIGTEQERTFVCDRCKGAALASLGAEAVAEPIEPGAQS